MLHHPQAPRLLIALLILACLLLALIATQPARSQTNYTLYAPLVMHFVPTSTPIPSPSGKIDIQSISFKGAASGEPDEYVEIKSFDTRRIQLEGWTLADNENHIFLFPIFEMQPGQTCRVYTNEVHPQWCGFGYGSASPIWNNTGECAFLRDSHGTLISKKCY